MMNRISPAVLLCSFFVCTNYGAASGRSVGAEKKSLTLRDFVEVKTIRVPGKQRHYVSVRTEFEEYPGGPFIYGLGFIESDTDSGFLKKAADHIKSGEILHQQRLCDDDISDALGEIAAIRYNMVFFNSLLYPQPFREVRYENILWHFIGPGVPSVFLPSNVVTMLSLLLTSDKIKISHRPFEENIPHMLQYLEAQAQKAKSSHDAPILYFNAKAFLEYTKRTLFKER